MKIIGLDAVLIAFLCFSSCETEELVPDPTKFYADQTILGEYAIQSIAFDSKGTAWIGTFNNGLIKYSLTETVNFDSSNSLVQNDMIWDIAIDSKDNIWIGGNGLTKYDGTKFTRFTTENSIIPEDVIWAIAIDSEDNVWFSSCRSRSGGIVKYNGLDFEVFTPDNSELPANSVEGIAIDSYDNVWLTSFDNTTESSLVRFANNQWTVYDGSEYDDPPFIFRKIEIDSNNRIFALHHDMFATPNHFFGYQGIFFQENEVERISLDSTIVFRSATFDNNNRLWAAHYTGYAMYNNESWYITSDDSYKNGVFTIAITNDNNIWIGTGSGIKIINNKN